MTAAALLVLVTVAAVSAWALRRQPGRRAVADFGHVWSFSPWGKQFMIDFWGLEAMLALWMVGHATAHDSLWTAVACIAAMPIFGAMAAALYWLVAVAS